MERQVILICLLLVGQGITHSIPENGQEAASEHVPTTIEMIESNGYPSETHYVTTEDGYILEVHRIPHGRNSVPGGPAVLLQHGLLCSSADWVVMGPEKGLAYILADAGYDVWMGNARGNTYSKNHTLPYPDEAEFWDFSWHEMGLYDLPAVIDTILNETEQQKLFYIGHSMGTTMFYVMTSIKTEYNDKIRAMFSLAPVAYMQHAQSPFVKIFAPFINDIDWLLKFVGVHEFFPSNELLHKLADLICVDSSFLQPVCSNVLFLIAGFDKKELNDTTLPAIIDHTPAGASTKELVHYGQLYNSGGFKYFDYGEEGNVKRYGSETPPDYEVEKITCPVSLHYGDNDWLAAVTDVHTLSTRLPNIVIKLDVPDREFSHLDFLWAIHVKSLLYDKVLSLMRRF